MAWIKKAYLYLVSLISLVIIIIGVGMLVNMGLKAALGVKDYIPYPQSCPASPDGKTAPCDPALMQQQAEADQANQANSKKRDIAQSLAFIIVGAPVFWYHWRLARKEA